MRWRLPHALLGLALLAGAAGLPAQDGGGGLDAPAPPGDTSAASESDGSRGLEGWLWNAEERTRSAQKALEAGDPATAAAALEQASRLREGARTRYNEGTGKLLAGSPDAGPLLEDAAGRADETLAARASYNLGNSRLGADDFQGAIDAYRDALLGDPTLEDARWNLELARRRLEQQQQEQQQQEQEQQGGEEEQQQQGDEQQEGDGEQQQGEQQEGEEQQQGDEQQQDGDEQQQQQQGEQQEGGGEREPGEQEDGSPPQPQPGGAGSDEKESPLPQFRDLPDMSAEEAAAILEAVENLEREQRREDALEAAARAGSVKKDW